MKASLRWLRDFLGPGITTEQVRDSLTERVATVDAVTRTRSDLGELVVGRVVEVERHPDADHLWLTKVDAGGGELLEVVCGASNVEKGASYPFAAVGTSLPGGVKIEKRKIRGRTSYGMLCSARELGLGADHAGILALETAAAPGTPFLDAVDAGDVTFEVDVLPNRPDLLAHQGLAREVAAGLGVKLRDWKIPEGALASVPARKPKSGAREAITAGVRVRVDSAEGCRRYVAVVIRGVTVAPSPRWLAERLEGAGVRPINNVVDVTNFMLHGFGQPMHAFDLARLGSEVTVRTARAAEKIVTLDGVERQLGNDMTVIAGAHGAEAIAGVIGGKRCEVGDGTRDLLLEAAVFDPKRVRATRKRLALSTEASYRFERHVDDDMVMVRAKLAAALITTLAGGTVADAPADVRTMRPRVRKVALRPSRAALVLGETVAAGRIGKLLTTVGFTAAGKGKDQLTVTPPSWRGDVVAEIDLIEEVARLHGYDSFSADLRPFRPTSVPDHPLVPLSRRLRELLAARGLYEVRPLPFVARGSDQRLRLRNPLSESEPFLRTSLFETLAQRAEYNLAQMQRSIRIFEVGTVFGAGPTSRPVERTHVGALILGPNRPPHFTDPDPSAFDLWDARALAELIVSTAFNGRHLKLLPKSAGERDGAVAQNLWTVQVDDEPVGTVALLALDAPVWAAPAHAVEIDITDARLSDQARAYLPLPATPAVEVDVALVVPDDVAASAVEHAIRFHGGDTLERVFLFDEFRGPGIESGSRSLAWRLTFRHPDRTLRDQEVESRREKLVAALTKELGVKQRAV